MSRCILRYYLRRQAAYCRTVGTVQAGLNALHRAAGDGAPFDLVLVDAPATHFEAMTLIGQVRLEQRLSATRVIALTELGQRAANPGVAASLNKPVRWEELTGVIGAVTGHGRPAGPRAAPARMQFQAGARVLLVEDNPVNQQVAGHILRSLGIEVEVAANGALGVAAVQARPFDAVLMDCQMPVMDGYAATAAIRAWEVRQTEPPLLRRLPIVAMTANALTGDREKCLAAGMDDYLSKPIKRDMLAPILARWLEPAAAPPASGARTAMPVPAGGPDAAGDGASAAPDLDACVLNSLRTLMGEDMHALVRLHLADTPRLLEEMESALGQGDRATLRRCAHSLKSTSATIGAARLRGLCEVLADDLADATKAQLRSAVAAARAAWPPLAARLGDWLQDLERSTRGGDARIGTR